MPLPPKLQAIKNKKMASGQQTDASPKKEETRVPIGLPSKHPAKDMESRYRKGYLDMIVLQVSSVLSDAAIQDAYKPVTRLLQTSLDQSYWDQRKIYRNHNAGKAGLLSTRAADAASSALIKFNVDQICKPKKNDAEKLIGTRTNRWVTYKRHKAFLFLDASRVLNNAGLNDLDSQVDRIADGLKIPIAVVHEVKTFLTTAGTPEEYRSVCAAIDALVNPPATKKKSVKKSAAAPKKATKKAPQPA